MFASQLLQRLKGWKPLTSTPRRPARRRSTNSVPCLECLEKRCLLASVFGNDDEFGRPRSLAFFDPRFASASFFNPPGSKHHQITLNVAAASDPDGDGIVHSPSITVEGRARTKERVGIDLDGDGRFEQVTRADRRGRFQFAVTVHSGESELRVQSLRRFRGEQAELFVTGKFHRSDVPGQPQEIRWQFDGDNSHNDVLIRAWASGEVLAQSGSHAVSPGSRPATGELFYLRSDNSWSSTETVFAARQKAGRLTVQLPSDAEGEWRVEVLARNRTSGEFRSVQSQSILVSSEPAILLKVNRTLANRFDAIHAELLTSAGQTPRNVLLIASLELPDGSQLELPSLTPGLGDLYEGVSKDSYFTLLNQSGFLRRRTIPLARPLAGCRDQSVSGDVGCHHRRLGYRWHAHRDD